MKVGPDITRPRLIVNADDYGYSEKINAAIERTAATGILTSTTAMVNMPEARQLPAFLSRFPHISAGLHVNLTEGHPILSAKVIPSLVDSSGLFLGWRSFVRRLLAGRVRSEHIRAEIAAQVEALTGLIGPFSHFDSHQHTHTFPQVLASILHVAKCRPSPRRVRTNRRLFISAGSKHRSTARLQMQHCVRHPLSIGGLLLKANQTARIHAAGFASPDYLLTPDPVIISSNRSAGDDWSTVLARLPRATIEINFHPGLGADEAVLCDPRIRMTVDNYLELVSFAAI